MERLNKLLLNLNNLLEKYDTINDIDNILKDYLHNHRVNKTFLKDYYFLDNQVPNINNSIWYSIDRYRYEQKNNIYLMINNHKFVITK